MRTPTAHTSALMLTTILLAVDTGGCVFNPTCDQLFTCNKELADGGDASAVGGHQTDGALGAGGAIGTGGGAGLDGAAGTDAAAGQGQGQPDAGKLDASMADAVDDTREGGPELIDASDSGALIDEADVIAPADVNEAEPTCNPNASPRDPSCPVDPEGIFVSPDGVDTNAGTKDKPLGTLSAGIGKAKAIGKPVFVCTRGNGAVDFTKPVVIDSTAPGTRLYGGYSCTDWHYLGQGAKTRVKTGAGEIPLTLQNATGIAVDDFAFEAADATADGGSSIAAFVTNSSTVSLARTTLKAGKGKKGATGKLAATDTNYELGSGATPAPAPGGQQSTTTAGGAQRTCVCKDGSSSTGAKGGDGKAAAPAESGATGTAQPAPQPSAGTGGTGETATDACANGKKGASSSKANNGHGAMSAGQLTAQGWQASTGGRGSTAGPGQGGGGGGGGVSTPSTPGGAGGGACGGCGGIGGPGGNSGGSSFALLSYGSLVTLSNCSLEASLAGDGAAGADGQAGQEGGAGGVPSAGGCLGGVGGKGGQGGIGGGGAGGLSVGVGYHGAKPTYSSDTTVTVPTQIAHGAGTGADAGSSDTQGAEGQSVQDLPL